MFEETSKKRTLNVMAMFDGMDMHPEKNVSDYRKEKQLKKKITSATIEARAKKNTKSNNRKKWIFF